MEPPASYKGNEIYSNPTVDHSQGIGSPVGDVPSEGLVQPAVAVQGATAPIFKPEFPSVGFSFGTNYLPWSVTQIPGVPPPAAPAPIVNPNPSTQTSIPAPYIPVPANLFAASSAPSLPPPVVNDSAPVSEARAETPPPVSLLEPIEEEVNVNDIKKLDPRHYTETGPVVGEELPVSAQWEFESLQPQRASALLPLPRLNRNKYGKKGSFYAATAVIAMIGIALIVVGCKADVPSPVGYKTFGALILSVGVGMAGAMTYYSLSKKKQQRNAIGYSAI